MVQEPRERRLRALLVVAVLATCAVLASTWDVGTTYAAGAPPVRLAPLLPGTETLHLETGPFDILPGQNPILNAGLIQKPPVDGYVVGIKPNIRLADGTVPPVDVIHLHHGTWFNDSAVDGNAQFSPQPFLAVGEEKTALRLPPGYGYPFKAGDLWTINYMIHDLTPAPAKIWITYDVDFIPATSPVARQITPVRPVYMDVQNGGTTFDVLQGSGTHGAFTYPDQAKDPYGGGPPMNEWTVDRDSVVVQTSGHLHPGGLHDDLWDDRTGPNSSERRTAHLFRSQAHYYEPAGAVSWDASLTASRPDYRVQLRKGDTLRINTTYDTTKASWYQSMGIMFVWLADGHGGKDPFTAKVDQSGYLTHGRLAENGHHGGRKVTLPDPTRFTPEQASSPIHIADFLYAAGDLTGRKTIPVVKAGRTLSFVNDDAPKDNGIWHTITACKAPCNKETGVAYPLANGKISFDSGELGLGGWPTAGRVTWKTPKTLPPGTYTYFCRIHPFMRGAFEVTPSS